MSLRTNELLVSTDASYENQSGKSGFAYSLRKHSDFHIVVGGNFKIPPSNIYEAELMCIGKALKRVLNLQGEDRQFRFLTINTDSQAAIDALNHRKRYLHNVVGAILDEVKKRYKVRFNKVKAHSYDSDVYSVENRTCDQLAVKSRKLCKIY